MQLSSGRISFVFTIMKNMTTPLNFETGSVSNSTYNLSLEMTVTVCSATVRT